MTNSIGTSASSMASMASMATSMFGNARDAIKAMADAATTADGAAEKQAAPAGPKVRLGSVLDCYA